LFKLKAGDLGGWQHSKETPDCCGKGGISGMLSLGRFMLDLVLKLNNNLMNQISLAAKIRN